MHAQSIARTCWITGLSFRGELQLIERSQPYVQFALMHESHVHASACTLQILMALAGREWKEVLDIYDLRMISWLQTPPKHRKKRRGSKGQPCLPTEQGLGRQQSVRDQAIPV